jgi:hypothetical protein
VGAEGVVPRLGEALRLKVAFQSPFRAT